MIDTKFASKILNLNNKHYHETIQFYNLLTSYPIIME